jgi:hypothetical protein
MNEFTELEIVIVNKEVVRDWIRKTICIISA